MYTVKQFHFHFNFIVNLSHWWLVFHLHYRELWPRPRGLWPRPRRLWPRPRGLWPRPRGLWPRPRGVVASALWGCGLVNIPGGEMASARGPMVKMFDLGRKNTKTEREVVESTPATAAISLSSDLKVRA